MDVDVVDLIEGCDVVDLIEGARDSHLDKRMNPGNKHRLNNEPESISPRPGAAAQGRGGRRGSGQTSVPLMRSVPVSLCADFLVTHFGVSVVLLLLGVSSKIGSGLCAAGVPGAHPPQHTHPAGAPPAHGTKRHWVRAKSMMQPDPGMTPF